MNKIAKHFVVLFGSWRVDDSRTKEFFWHLFTCLQKSTNHFLPFILLILLAPVLNAPPKWFVTGLLPLLHGTRKSFWWHWSILDFSVTSFSTSIKPCWWDSFNLWWFQWLLLGCWLVWSEQFVWWILLLLVSCFVVVVFCCCYLWCFLNLRLVTFSLWGMKLLFTRFPISPSSVLTTL